MLPDDPFVLPRQDSFILVVDDTPENIKVVGAHLSDAGYEIMPATSGSQALERVKARRPDLILLDLMMPGMDGLEVCRRLKAEASTHSIPVIFLTASTELDHLTQAFEAGAVDYVTKPFKSDELLARVATHLELKYVRDALINQRRRLQELNDEKNELLGIAAHDLRNPLSNLLGLFDLLADELPPTATPARDLLQDMRASVTRLLQLVKDLLDVNRIERGALHLQPTAVLLDEVAATSVDMFRPKAAAKQQLLSLALDGTPLRLQADFNATTQIIENLVSNAVKYSPRGQPIHVRATRHEGAARLEVQDHGPGIPAADRARLFGKFARLSAKPTANEPSTGLGLSIVKRLVEASGAKVWYESRPGTGATFVVEWPLAED